MLAQKKNAQRVTKNRNDTKQKKKHDIRLNHDRNESGVIGR